MQQQNPGRDLKTYFQRLARSRWLQVLLSCIISLGAMYLALKNISLQDIRLVFSNTKWGYLIPALMAVGVHHGAKTLRWKLLLSPLPVSIPVHVPLKELFLALMAGQMLNLVYPARLGDFGRIWLIGNRGYGNAATTGTLVMEKFIDTICYALLLFVLTLLITIPDWLASSWIFLGSILVGFGLLLFISRNDKFWIKFSGIKIIGVPKENFPAERILGWVYAFRDGLAGVQRLKGYQPFTRLFLWSAVSWGMSLFINWLMSNSLGIRFESLADTIAAHLLVLVALQVGIAVPSLPGRIGLFEYICILALGVFGISISEAFSYGLLLHVVVMVPTLLSGWAGLLILGLDMKQTIHELKTDQNS